MSEIFKLLWIREDRQGSADMGIFESLKAARVSSNAPNHSRLALNLHPERRVEAAVALASEKFF